MPTSYDLQQFIKNPRFFTHLELYDQNLTDDDCKKLAGAFKKAKLLIHLGFVARIIKLLKYNNKYVTITDR